MSTYARKHLTAWLGLVAMWLIVLAPLVSQSIVAHREQQPEAPLCSAALPGAAGHHDTQNGTFAACGYCDLLATHTPISPVPAVSLPVLALVVVATVPALFIRFTPLAAFPSGRPRAPPAFR